MTVGRERRRRPDVRTCLSDQSVFSRHHVTTPHRIIRIPFTGSVKLRSILVKAGPGDQTPAKLSLVCNPHLRSPVSPHLILIQTPVNPKFANQDNIDFSDIADKHPDQEFHIPESRDVGEYAVKYVIRMTVHPSRFGFGFDMSFLISELQNSPTSRP